MTKPTALAVCTTAIGDTLLSIPALDCLGRRYDLDVLVHQHRLALLENQPNVRQLYAYRNNSLFRLSLAWRLCRKRYDRLVIMHANDDLKKLMPRISYDKAYNIQGWAEEHLRIEALNLPADMHVIDKRLIMAQLAGGKENVDPTPRVFLLEEEKKEAESWLVEKGLHADSPRVAFVPGAANLFKRWPAQRFGDVARALHAKGVGVFCVGTGSEMNLFEQIDKVAGQPVPKLVDVPLRRLAAGISRANILLTNDTGPLHMGQAVGTRVLGLFGPTDPVTIGPRGPQHRVVKVDRTCNPCRTKQCDDPKCMKNLKVEKVLDVLNEMLDQLGDTTRL